MRWTTARLVMLAAVLTAAAGSMATAAGGKQPITVARMAKAPTIDGKVAPGEWEPTFTIITTSANATLEPVHDRMPVILPDEAVDEWLHGRQDDFAALGRLLVPAADDLLTGTPVSARFSAPMIWCSLNLLLRMMTSRSGPPSCRNSSFEWTHYWGSGQCYAEWRECLFGKEHLHRELINEIR